jgi:lipopolysaccharide biosynthesis glycosyltransferase
LYLDGDAIVQKQLDFFYNTPFDNQAFVVSEDMGEVLFFHKERHEIFNIPKSYRYFNSGVLLINLDYFRQGYDFNTIFSFVKNNASRLKFLDQDVLNALFYDKVKFIDSIYFDYLEILVSHLLDNNNMDKSTIVHFLKKPWRYDYNGINSEYWWKYGKMVYKFEYLKFLIINLIYRKLLGIILLFTSVKILKKIKKNI